MPEQPWEPETPDEDLPQDPGIPGGALRAEQRDREGGMQVSRSRRDDPHGIDRAAGRRRNRRSPCALSKLNAWRKTSRSGLETAVSVFPDRLAAAVDQKRSQLLVGLDPRPELLPVELRGEAHWSRGAAADACDRFCRGLVTRSPRT